MFTDAINKESLEKTDIEFLKGLFLK